MKIVWLIVGLMAGLCLCAPPAAQAEVLRKRYTLPNSTGVTEEAKRRLIQDYLREKLSPQLITDFAEAVDIALDPPDQYVQSFQIVSQRESGNSVVVTVEGEMDTAAMVTALVLNKVITFGSDPPRIMFLSAPESQDQRATNKVRALAFKQMRQAGLQAVADQQVETLQVRIKDITSASETQRQVLVRKAKEYNADFLIYISTEVDAKSVLSGKRFVTDTNLTYTIFRPNGNLILAEATIRGRGQGVSEMLAFDSALDGDGGDDEGITKAFARDAIGQLYEAIFAASEVGGSGSAAAAEKIITITGADSLLVTAISQKLKTVGDNVRLLTGGTTSARLRLETSLDDLGLYEWFTAQTFVVGAKRYQTPVTFYAENQLEVEAVLFGAKPHKKPATGKPQPRAKPQNTTPTGKGTVLAFKLRDRQY